MTDVPIPNAWRFGPPDGPKSVLIGGVHGNEPCGVVAVHHLRDALVDRPFPSPLLLIHGNPAATDLQLRNTPSGEDLNRLFSGVGPSGTTEGASSDHRRAREVASVVHDAALLLDLHGASAPTPPYAVIACTKAHVAFCAALGVRLAVTDVERFTGGSLVGQFVDRCGGTGITVECGKGVDPEAAARAVDFAERFAALVAGGGIPPAQRGAVALYRVESVKILDEGDYPFAFAGEPESFARVRAGDVIGEGPRGPLTAAVDFIMVLPRPGCPAGDVLYYDCRELPADLVEHWP